VTRGLKGLQGLDHVGIAVPDLDEAVEFYSHLLEAVEIVRLGPFDARELPAPDERDWSLAFVNVADARFTLALLALPSGRWVELFQCDRPTDWTMTPPRNCDIGGHHVAFKVEDFDRILDSAAGLGIQFMAGSIAGEQGPVSGQSVTYALDPLGNQFEFVEYPDGW
jgi:catechol 2,3-dioxygenase-like lactoylglutathione lyase family enzyme